MCSHLCAKLVRERVSQATYRLDSFHLKSNRPCVGPCGMAGSPSAADGGSRGGQALGGGGGDPECRPPAGGGRPSGTGERTEALPQETSGTGLGRTPMDAGLARSKAPTITCWPADETAGCVVERRRCPAPGPPAGGASEWGTGPVRTPGLATPRCFVRDIHPIRAVVRDQPLNAAD